MKSKFASLLLLAAAASQLGSTDCGQVLRDPGFDLWCGDSLCAWQLERGNIARVPTWDAGDPGVSFVGDDVAIAQLSPVTSADGTCIKYQMITNIDDNATVWLNIDVEGDGSFEYKQQVGASTWQPVAYHLYVQAPFDGIQFELAKTGPGNAVFAQIQVTIDDDANCSSQRPIIAAPRPDGAVCGVDSDCRSSLCSASQYGICESCDSTLGTVCPSGQVCGYESPTSSVLAASYACVADGAKQLAENCVLDEECATGICNGVCSTCITSAGCPNGETCGQAWTTPNADGTVRSIGPSVCAPNSSLQVAGAPCASDDDCASSSCVGTVRSQCDDGRACATAADCPFDTEPNENGLQNGPCNTVGVQGGSCQ